MKLGGYRHDGTLRVLIPGGMTVLLRGESASPPLDDADADRFGPWIAPDTTLTWQERQTLARRLDRSHLVPMSTFLLQFPFKKAAPDAAAAPPTKGDLLTRIAEIAKAQEAKATKDAEVAPDADKDKDKADADKPAIPRRSTQRLKLEYEVDDSEGEDRKPVSEVAPPVPDHLQPMEKRS